MSNSSKIRRAGISIVRSLTMIREDLSARHGQLFTVLLKAGRKRAAPAPFQHVAPWPHRKGRVKNAADKDIVVHGNLSANERAAVRGGPP